MHGAAARPGGGHSFARRSAFRRDPCPLATRRLDSRGQGSRLTALLRALHAGAAQAAIAAGILGQVLLVVVLGVVELRCFEDLGRDRTEAGRREALLERRLRADGSITLLLVEPVDARAVLGARVVALAHPLRGIVGFPEDGQEILVGDLRGIVDDQHHFVVSGLARAHFLVAGIGRDARGIAHRGGIHARHLPELSLDAPEAAEAEHPPVQVGGKRCLQRMAIDEVPFGHRHRGGTALQGRVGRRQLERFLAEPHVPCLVHPGPPGDGGEPVILPVTSAGRRAPVTTRSRSHAPWQS
jgi:hypothetical protein